MEEHDDDPGTLYNPGPSNETDKRAHDSSNECSGIKANEAALLAMTELPLVSRAGVECDSSCTTKQQQQHTWFYMIDCGQQN